MWPGPIVPPPPGLFSIRTGWPRYFAAISAKRRRWVSVEPPAGQGQIRLIGRDGNSWAGRGIGQIAAQAGIRALLHDSRPGAAKDAKESVSAQLAKLAEKGRLERDAVARAQANLVVTDSLSALATCPIVIEAIVENLDAKR